MATPNMQLEQQWNALTCKWCISSVGNWIQT